MNKELNYELVVIGGGPGGYAAAFRAADLGKKVLIIEKDNNLGGVCLNRGCIPSKALLHLAKIIEDTKSIKSHGVKFNEPILELHNIDKWKNSIINKLSKGIDQLAKARGVKVLNGKAEFISPKQLKVSNGDDKTISFKDCIIATGSKPSSIPKIIVDHKKIINSTDALNISTVPKKMLIIGGGYIGLEMGSVYSSLGSKITIVEFMPNILPNADPDLVMPLFRKFKKSFENLYLSTQVKNVNIKKNIVQVEFSNENSNFTENFDQVLVSAGRTPNTNDLGLEKIGVDLCEKKYILVNEKRETSIKNIYAIGDVTGDPMLAHKATHEGKVAAEVISGCKSAFEPAVIPAVIFTDPEIAWAGPTENELKNKGIKYEKGEFPWAASGRALAIDAIQGKTKLLFDPKSRKIISAGIVGPNAGDLIGETILAIEMGADVDDISLSIHPHPTLTETIANAAEMFNGTITDLFIPKN